MDSDLKEPRHECVVARPWAIGSHHPVGPNSDDAPAAPRCVLVVDDDVGIRRVLSLALTKAGLKVMQAADGCQALSLLEARAHEIDLVVTDLDMPNMDGATLIAAVRAKLPGLAIMVMRGSNEALAALQGADIPVLQKPFELAALNRIALFGGRG